MEEQGGLNMDTGAALLLISIVMIPIITVIAMVLFSTTGGGHSEDESRSPYDTYYLMIGGKRL